MKRWTGLLLAFAMFAMSFAALEGVVKTEAATETTIAVSNVVITGTAGTEMEEQTIEITVSDGKFDTAQFYVGKDISDYFVEHRAYGDRDPYDRYYNNLKNAPALYGCRRYFKPIGVKIIITQSTEEKITCSVSGTPLFPSTNMIGVYFSPAMFSEYNKIGVLNPRYVDTTTSSDTRWKIASADGKIHNTPSVTINGLKQADLKGTAGVTEFNKEFTITLKDAIFAKKIKKDEDVSSWFSGITMYNENSNTKLTQLPVGLHVKAVSDINIGDTTCTLKLTGIPTYGNSNWLICTIPGECVAAGKNSSYWEGSSISSPDSSKGSLLYFNITGLQSEPAYLASNAMDMYVYAGVSYYNYNLDDALLTPQLPRVYFAIYNAKLNAAPDADITTWLADSSNNAYLYSNIKGDLDKNSEGFMYSPCSGENTFGIRNVGAAYGSDNSLYSRKPQHYYFALTGMPYNTGIYPVSLFLPNSLLNNSESEGYTPAVVDKGRLIVIKPYQLEIDDFDQTFISGKKADAFVTVKVAQGDLRSLNNLKDGLTPETLKYKVSQELTSKGLKLTPVVVNYDRVVFKMSGKATGSGTINLADCITLSYENFDGNYTNASRFGDIEIQANPDAVLKIEANEAGDYAEPGEEIDYSPREDVIIYAKNASGQTVTTAAINMTQEKLVTTVDYKCYSIDGGTKWKEAKSKFNDKQFQKMLEKGMTFAIADAYDKKAKGPAEGATVLTFDEVTKAEGKPKFKIDYKTYADETGNTAGKFILTDASGTVLTAKQIREEYEIGIVSGKNLSDKGYGIWPEEGGVSIAPLASNGKVQKTAYFIRKAATATSAPGKYAKLSVMGLQKAPKLKIDYKKEILKGKEKLCVAIDGTVIAKNMDKDEAKEGIDLSWYLAAGERPQIRIWSGASEKKPATALQVIEAAARAEAVTSGAVTLSAGKLKLGKNYEAYDSTKDKWGGLPKITDSCTILVRIKANAKGGKESDTTFAASDSMKLVVTYGIIDEKKNKEGVVSAVVTP